MLFDTAKIDGLVHRLVASWNRGDGPAFADCFTADATYLTGAGETKRGRRQIEELVPPSSESLAIAVENLVVTRAADGAVTATFRWDAREQESTDGRGGTIVCRLVESEGRWRIADLRNEEAA